MASTLQYGPVSDAEDTSPGTYSITNRGNAYAADASYTGVSGTGTPSNWAIWYFQPGTDMADAGFVSGSTIDGIQGTVTAKRSGAAGGIADVRAVKVSTIAGSGTGAITLTGSDVAYTVGGPTDTLGFSWTHAEIAGGQLGIAIQVSAFAPGHGQINLVTVKIWYTPPAGGSSYYQFQQEAAFNGA